MNTSKLIDSLGGTAKVAELVGIKSPSVSEWRANDKIPRDKLILLAPYFEKAGVISRKELFPDTWDLIWPELKKGKAA